MVSRAQSRVTTDHDEIRRWAEERGGQAAVVADTGSDADPGILRIDFPGYSGEGTLQAVDWETWFRKFDESGLAFLFQETTAGSERSNFNKIVSRETAGETQQERRSRSAGAQRSEGRASGRRTSGRRSSARRTAAGRRASSGRSTRKSSRSQKSRRQSTRATSRRSRSGSGSRQRSGSTGKRTSRSTRGRGNGRKAA